MPILPKTYAVCRDWVRRNPVAAAILLLGAALRLAWLTRQSLWSDEATTLVVARAQAGAMAMLGAVDNSPPLHSFLLRLWLPLWSDALVGLRAFSALCGIGALCLCWPLFRSLMPGRAPLILFLAACSSFWIHAAQTGRHYSLFLLLAVGQIGLAWRLRGSWSGRAAALYAALAVAGVYTHYYYHLLVFSLGLSLLLERRFRERALKPWLALHAVVGLSFLPWVPTLLAQQRITQSAWVLTERLSPGLIAQAFGTFLVDAGYLGLAFPGWVRVLGWVLLLVVAAGFWRMRREATRDEAAAARFCLLNLAIPLAVVAVAETALHRAICQPRYLVAFPVFFFPLLALAVERGWRQGTAVPEGAGRPPLGGGGWRGVAGAGRAAPLALAFAAAGGACAHYASNIVLDSRMAALSDHIRRSSDRRDPIVHWGDLQYIELRYYYLPERAHFVLERDPSEVRRILAFPGYPGVVTPRRLAAWPRCVVIDPLRRAFRHRVGLASGPAMLRLGGGP
ncbi:MAG: glycosyltransferase family 39 protein [Elusimicrobia bacterium]|nr:glycosyltransferase family 39 protein [Elusimicrobiota bacterium]